MSRAKEAFEQGKALIPFITAGDPGFLVTEQLIVGMAGAGADLIEIGIPFSDPVEGNAVRRADERALAAGATTDKLFDMVKSVRCKTEIPLAFMTYANSIYTYGRSRFLKKCSELRIDAVIVPDVPFEEKGELAGYCRANQVDLISMIAPASRDRIQMIAKEAEGFVYCVSSMGAAGFRSEIIADAGEMLRLVKEARKIPCAAGSGVSTPEQAREIAGYADGVIVDSAIVEIVERYGADCVGPVCDYVREIKRALE